MEGKPLTSEAIALAEKKMDMTLDDIIKMSKSKTAKPRRQRVSNRTQKFVSNVSQDKSSKVRRFMDSKSSLRQGFLAQRRSNFQGNHLPLATEAARKAAISPIGVRTFPRSRAVNVNKLRVGVLPFQRRPTNAGPVTKQQHQQRQQPPHQPTNVSKPKPQTLDSLFANMKEQRMRVVSQQSNERRWSAANQQRTQWGRSRFGN